MGDEAQAARARVQELGRLLRQACRELGTRELRSLILQRAEQLIHEPAGFDIPQSQLAVLRDTMRVFLYKRRRSSSILRLPR